MALGYNHPDYLLETLTSRQISEWEAYSRLEPFGEERGDLRMAILTSHITNMVSSLYSKKNEKPKMVSPSVFMPHFGEETEIEKEVKTEKEVDNLRSQLMGLTKKGE